MHNVTHFSHCDNLGSNSDNVMTIIIMCSNKELLSLGWYLILLKRYMVDIPYDVFNHNVKKISKMVPICFKLIIYTVYCTHPQNGLPGNSRQT